MTAIRARYWLGALVVLLLAAGAAWMLWPVPPSGPWRAQIVDAETGQSVEGVIVLAIWDRKSFGWPHPDREHYDAEELVSDHDGRVVIAARHLPRATPLHVVIGPIVTMFKSGYGVWRFRRAGGLRDAKEWADLGGDAVFELVRAKTLDERRRALLWIVPPYDVPPAKMPRTLAARDHEIAVLEGSPTQRGTKP